MADGWLKKGNAHYDAQRWEDAGVSLERALAEDPRDAGAWYRLGNVREEQGRDTEAAACFEHVLILDASHAKSWNNLGAAWQRLGRGSEALGAYQAALANDPQLLQPYLNLGRLCEDRGELEAAAGYLSAGLACHPGDPILVHLLAAARGENTPRAPRDYIVAFFDGFAEDFDEHLVHSLGYRLPGILAQLVRPMLAPPARVFDLGCGTGLIGAAIANPGIDLVGVDLSPRMLALAEQRKVYSRLVLADVTEAVALADEASYRAVLAAEVFIYMGDLAATFNAVARALEPGGVFAFSLEILQEGSYELQPSGRYAHNLEYVRALAHASGLRELRSQPVAIRREKHGFAEGMLVLLERL